MLDLSSGSFDVNLGARIEVVRRRRAFEAESEVGVDGPFRDEPEALLIAVASYKAYKQNSRR